jgi:hypothetical protein
MGTAGATRTARRRRRTGGVGAELGGSVDDGHAQRRAGPKLAGNADVSEIGVGEELPERGWLPLP